MQAHIADSETPLASKPLSAQYCTTKYMATTHMYTILVEGTIGIQEISKGHQCESITLHYNQAELI